MDNYIVIIVIVLIIIFYLIYNNISDLKFTDLTIIATALGLFLYKVDLFNTRILIKNENKAKESMVSGPSSSTPTAPIPIDQQLIDSINATIPEPKYDHYSRSNKITPTKKLVDEFKERIGDTSNDVRPFVKKIQQIAFAPVAAEITRAGHHMHSVKRIYDEELDKSESSVWYEGNNEMDDKLYDMVKKNKLGLN